MNGTSSPSPFSAISNHRDVQGLYFWCWKERKLEGMPWHQHLPTPWTRLDHLWQERWAQKLYDLPPWEIEQNHGLPLHAPGQQVWQIQSGSASVGGMVVSRAAFQRGSDTPALRIEARAGSMGMWPVHIYPPAIGATPFDQCPAAAILTF